MEPKPLSFEEQLLLFEKRGMVIEKEHNLKKLENIGYYRLKGFARPLSKTTNGNIDYSELTFGEVLERYYQDKNLRIFLLHAIEKIEVSVKTQLSNILGNYYGPFGYLNFSKWGNRKFSILEMKKRENRFKDNLLKSMRKISSIDVCKESNHDEKGYPTVWLAIDIITFGGLVSIVEVLAKRHLKALAAKYNCTSLEFISWLKTLNLIRNICAHNSNIIDIKLKTVPLSREEWRDSLFIFEDDKPTNRLAIILFILKHFIDIINDRYQWRNINRSVINIVKKSNTYAKSLGFKNWQALKIFCNTKHQT